MKEVLALAASRSYDLIIEDGITAHPIGSPYPKEPGEYLIPIKKGGSLEVLYYIEDYIECYPDEISLYEDKLSDGFYNHLMSYHLKRMATMGYSHENSQYRFYYLRYVADIKQPSYKKGIQVSCRMDLASLELSPITYQGLLIKESLQDENILDLVTVTDVQLWKTDNDPKYWTAISFETKDPCFPEKLSKALMEHPSMPWYVDFKVNNTKYIVLRDHVLTYEIGNNAAKDLVMKECLRYGIRADQLDWTE